MRIAHVAPFVTSPRGLKFLNIGVLALAVMMIIRLWRAGSARKATPALIPTHNRDLDPNDGHLVLAPDSNRIPTNRIPFSVTMMSLPAESVATMTSLADPRPIDSPNSEPNIVEPSAEPQLARAFVQEAGDAPIILRIEDIDNASTVFDTPDIPLVRRHHHH